MATTQLNVRIDDGLHKQGNEVFARFGLSSAEVARAVYEHAAKTDSVPTFLQKKKPEMQEREMQRKLALMEEGARLWKNFFTNQGLPILRMDSCVLDEDGSEYCEN